MVVFRYIIDQRLPLRPAFWLRVNYRMLFFRPLQLASVSAMYQRVFSLLVQTSLSFSLSLTMPSSPLVFSTSDQRFYTCFSLRFSADYLYDSLLIKKFIIFKVFCYFMFNSQISNFRAHINSLISSNARGSLRSSSIRSDSRSEQMWLRRAMGVCCKNPSSNDVRGSLRRGILLGFYFSLRQAGEMWIIWSTSMLQSGDVWYWLTFLKNPLRILALLSNTIPLSCQFIHSRQILQNLGAILRISPRYSLGSSVMLCLRVYPTRNIHSVRLLNPRSSAASLTNTTSGKSNLNFSTTQESTRQGFVVSQQPSTSHSKEFKSSVWDRTRSKVNIGCFSRMSGQKFWMCFRIDSTDWYYERRQAARSIVYFDFERIRPQAGIPFFFSRRGLGIVFRLKQNFITSGIGSLPEIRVIQGFKILLYSFLCKIST